MKIEWLIQKDGNNTIGKNIIEAFDRKPKKVYAVMSDLKDSGLYVLEEGYIDTKAEFNVVVAYNKKNTTKLMLESLLRHAEKVHVYDNNAEIGFDANLFVFVYKESVVIYTYAGSTTESTLITNSGMYTKVILDLSLEKDKETYKALKKSIADMVKECNMEELSRDMLTKMQEEKKIFTPRIYTHNVKTVAELLAETKKDAKKEEENVYVEDAKNNMLEKVDLDLNNFNIDIEFTEDAVKEPDNILDKGEDMDNIEIPEEEYASEYSEENVEEEVGDLEDVFESVEEEENIDSEVIDLENVIFGSSKIKLKEKDFAAEEEDAEEEEKVLSKKLDLNSATTLVMQLPKRATRGKEVNVIKVPNYLKQMLPSFINFTKNLHNVKTAEDEYKYQKIKFTVLDVEENKEYVDEDAKLVQRPGQTYIAFASDALENVTIKEGYIARILKVAEEEYRCEIVPLDSLEYPVWNKVCNLVFRGSERKYGIM